MAFLGWMLVGIFVMICFVAVWLMSIRQPTCPMCNNPADDYRVVVSNGEGTSMLKEYVLCKKHGIFNRFLVPGQDKPEPWLPVISIPQRR